jgi:hypothetical protein
MRPGRSQGLLTAQRNQPVQLEVPAELQRWYDGNTTVTKAGKFKNNDEANQMFQRPYREGWKLPV